MILVTWNCAARIDLSVIKDFAADVLVLTEPRLERLPQECKSIWDGEKGKKGIAIISGATTTVDRIDILGLPKRMILAKVTGSISFLLLAVWTQDDYQYVRGLHRALDLCEKYMISQPTVILGDFNSHTRWDGDHPSDLNHSALVKRLKALGLESAYHSHFRQEQGNETWPTFYLKKNEKWPSHVDYYFLPKTWTVKKVTVGRYEDWISKSDHMPLVVAVDEQTLSTRSASSSIKPGSVSSSAMSTMRSE